MNELSKVQKYMFLKVLIIFKYLLRTLSQITTFINCRNKSEINE